MKGPLDRTKVVLRHLPPAISQSTLMDEIDPRFAGRYNWVSFRPCKNSQKHQSHSRAYVDFKRPEDVVEFAEFFDGHLFVNEKGTQFKTIVEYAPSQRVPKQWSKKDGREGTILQDPEYMEFLEFLAKPVENLPSAEIQLERKEAERAGAVKESPIVTPLMDYVRQKRAAKSGSRRSMSSGKLSRRAVGSSVGNSSSVAPKRVSEKGRNSTMRYVLRDSAKNTSRKDKSNIIVVSKGDDLQLSDKSVGIAAAGGNEAVEDDNGISGNTDVGRKKFVLLKGKDKDTFNVAGSMPSQQTTSPIKSVSGGVSGKHNQRREGGSGKIIKTILLNSSARANQSSSFAQSEQQIQTSSIERDKRPARTPHAQLALKDAVGTGEDKFYANEAHTYSVEKHEKRTRNKDRPDRAVWAPLRRSDGSYASDESLSSSTSQATQMTLDSFEGGHGEMKAESIARSGVVRTSGSGRISQSLDNGSYKHVGRRGPIHAMKDADALPLVGEGKSSKRGPSGYGSHEKQVWVQKSSSGS